MSLHTQIKNDLKVAMKNREALRLETIRSIKTAFVNELVAKNKTPQDELPDDQALTVLKRLHKQRIEAHDQYEAAGREDLAKKEAAEAEIIEAYLPEQLTDEEIEKIVEKTAEENDISDSSKMGILIGKVMGKVGNQASGARVKDAVQKHLS